MLYNNIAAEQLKQSRLNQFYVTRSCIGIKSYSAYEFTLPSFNTSTCQLANTSEKHILQCDGSRNHFAEILVKCMAVNAG